MATRGELELQLRALESELPDLLSRGDPFLHTFESRAMQIEAQAQPEDLDYFHQRLEELVASTGVNGLLQAQPWLGLPREFFQYDANVVAPRLLNKLLVMDDGRAGRIVEVEAYVGTLDPAAHTYGGRTARNAVVFGEPGHLYVYRSYGIHWCANCVCGPEGVGSAVLIRALEPLDGLEAMREARGPKIRDRDLCRGPGNMCHAMGITGEDNGADITDPTGRVRAMNDLMRAPFAIGTPRIGISMAKDLPWRWRVPGNRFTSGPLQREA
ncbi:MAG TPA: DNA-3-methyladenine glycosylase [Dyella sp.]|uniref:DNA-3-methyladenine glycosylase n=1 Tax=Dyella sp. TaxID=1869338 RepID=UPI002D76ADA7|nr:DNA-3-methyladenine glycosylase [Dyella sp.]HET6553420.1 DNA-3-methyladenine glycosylase [Dyella sp.]